MPIASIYERKKKREIIVMTSKKDGLLTSPKYKNFCPNIFMRYLQSKGKTLKINQIPSKSNL